MSVDERKFVAASILHSSSISDINNNPDLKKNLSQTLINKFEIDSKYTDQLLDSEKDELVLETLKGKIFRR